MPYVLPEPKPTRKWWEEYSAISGRTFDILLNALAGQVASGGGSFAPQNIPNPTYGQTGSPGTQFSVPPTGQPLSLAPPQNPQQIKQGVRSFVPASPYAAQPMLNAGQFENLRNLQSYQKSAQDLDPNSPINAYIKSLTTPQTPGGFSPEMRQQLEDDALAGDEDSIAAYRKLKALGVL